MVPVDVLTLIMAPAPGVSVLVLQPTEDMGTERDSRVVPIWVGVSEATQLGIALEHVRFPRPMTHDLFLDALTNLDAVVESVVIDDVRGHTFYAKLKLQHRGRTITLDARPSDAISLALREQAPLFMSEEVLERASFPYLFGKREDEQELAEFHDFVSGIAPEDFSDEEEWETGIFRNVNSLEDLNIIVPDAPSRLSRNGREERPADSVSAAAAGDGADAADAAEAGGSADAGSAGRQAGFADGPADGPAAGEARP